MSAATKLVAFVLALSGSAGPFATWHQEVTSLGGAMTPELAAARGEVSRLVDARIDLYEANGPYEVPPRRAGRASSTSQRYADDVERWRPVVEAFFHPGDVRWAMRVMNCESGGDPRAANPRSSARGLFQHLKRLWPERAAAAGWPGADIFDPVANVAVAAWLYYQDGPGHWVCR